MSNSSIEGKLKGLQERFENEMRIRREGGFNNQGGIGTPRPGGGRTRPKPREYLGDNVQCTCAFCSHKTSIIFHAHYIFIFAFITYF